MLGKSHIPSRGDIVLLDLDPTKGKEIGKYRPVLVLTSKAYAEQSRLLMCCPISTSMRGGHGEIEIKGLDRKSVVVCNMIKTYSWPDRNMKFIAKADDDTVKRVFFRAISYLGASQFLE